MKHKFIRLTFYHEPDYYLGYGGRPTEKRFHLDPDCIEYMVEYDVQNCTKLCMKSGKEIYVVEKIQEIIGRIHTK